MQSFFQIQSYQKTANHVSCEKFCAGSSFKERKVTQVNTKDHLTKGFIRFIISAPVVKMQVGFGIEERSKGKSAHRNIMRFGDRGALSKKWNYLKFLENSLKFLKTTSISLMTLHY